MLEHHHTNVYGLYVLELEKLFKLAEINLLTEKNVLKLINSWDKSFVVRTSELLLLLIHWIDTLMNFEPWFMCVQFVCFVAIDSKVYKSTQYEPKPSRLAVSAIVGRVSKCVAI